MGWLTILLQLAPQIASVIRRHVPNQEPSDLLMRILPKAAAILEDPAVLRSFEVFVLAVIRHVASGTVQVAGTVSVSTTDRPSFTPHQR